MTVQTFYRLVVWLPLAVPAVVALLAQGAGIRSGIGTTGTFVGLFVMSLTYGGLPYALLAFWATLAVGDRTEWEIRRMALKAPLWMIPAFTACVAGPLGILHGDTRLFLGLVAFGGAMSLALGYAWVGVAFGLRALADLGGLITSQAAET
jgi:hypothetical protein